MKEKLLELSHILNKLSLIDDAISIIKLSQGISNRDIVIATLVGEASVDGVEGMTAIYSIIKNRANHKGISMSQVCLENKQFSMWNDKASADARANFIAGLQRAPGGVWPDAAAIVDGDPADTTRGSLHYYTGSTPYWATSKNPCWIPRTKIGSHTFGIDLSANWIDYEQLAGDILSAYQAEGKTPARCYIDKPNRYPPKSIQ